MIWIPNKEREAMEKMAADLREESKNLDWTFKCLMQMKFENGEFDHLDPVIRYSYKILAYGE